MNVSKVDRMEIIATFRKSDSAEIRITKDTYKNRQVIDFRVWFMPAGQTEMVRSQRGVTFDIEKLPEIVEGLKQAL